MSEVIRVQSLTRRYGDLLALDDVDLDLDEGMVLGLVGKNGAGKTSLIRHLLGLLRAQSGTVTSAGAG